jgi:hypothetical protein
MARCFCECGQKVGFGSRAVNKRGSVILGDLTKVEMLRRSGLASPNADQFVEYGRVLLAALKEAVHTGTKPGHELETETRGFMALGRQFGTAAVGRAVMRSGVSSDEAPAAIRAGKFDPFMGINMPEPYPIVPPPG